MTEQRWTGLIPPERSGCAHSHARSAARRTIVQSVAVPALVASLLVAATPSESLAPQLGEPGVEGAFAPGVGDRIDDSRVGAEKQRRVLSELLRQADSIAVSASGGRVLYLSWGQGVRASDPRSIPPAAGRVSSGFLRERRHPVVDQLRPHRGVDIAAPWGAPILAPSAGVVVYVGSEVGYGKVVVIDHGEGVQTVYAHCSQILVSERQQVTREDPIALVGDTGLTTGPHLHYEVRVHGRHVDPLRHSW